MIQVLAQNCEVSAVTLQLNKNNYYFYLLTWSSNLFVIVIEQAIVQVYQHGF
jgi:hypothetical protein